MDWIKVRWPRLPKVLVESEEEGVAVSETLFDLRSTAYRFVPFVAVDNPVVLFNVRVRRCPKVLRNAVS